MECPDCGFISSGGVHTHCPKCGSLLKRQFVDELFVVDVAHQGEDWTEAKMKIDDALDKAIRGNYKGLMIIHGHGSETGHTSIIKDNAIPYLRKLAKRHKGRLVQDKKTDGAHILYFN